jgi:hypothetical protein
MLTNELIDFFEESEMLLDTDKFERLRAVAVDCSIVQLVQMRVLMRRLDGECPATKLLDDLIAVLQSGIRE